MPHTTKSSQIMSTRKTQVCNHGKSFFPVTQDKETLLHKPLKLQQQGNRSLTIHINYQEKAFGQLSLNYIRADTGFKREWEHKFFASPCRVTSEMVATHEAPNALMTIKGRDAFQKRETLRDHPEHFGNPEFWEQYNIIAPTESLEKGIERFNKKNSERCPAYSRTHKF